MSFPLKLLIITALIFDFSVGSPAGKFDKLKQYPIFKKNKDVQYRLPVDILPVHYRLDIKLEEDAFDTNIFYGTVSISLQVINSVNEIKLHSRYITINELELRNGDNLIETSYQHDSLTEILTIQSSENLISSDNYTLSISYSGILSETSMKGFYESSYTEADTVNYLATTQFESTSARQAFPCFDEPAFKANYDVTIIFPKGYNALSNTVIVSQEEVDGNLQKVTFATTPKMSTYLVAFVVSKFTCTEGDFVDGIPTNVCSRNGIGDATNLAVSTGPKVLEVMKNFTNFSFANFNLNKLTQIAIPDFSPGAMENWGLSTFREAALLWDPNESSNTYQKRVVTTISHELSHQWFGDLVTLNWWSNIFLNEGFATYFEYHAADAIYPEWELTKQFVVEQLQVALETDSLGFGRPLSFYVETPDAISNRFDDISYNKGGSILRMVHHFLGLENFKAGLADYVAENKFSNSNPTILWKSFEKYASKLPQPQTPPVSVSEIMENWTNKSGYPVLMVELVGNNIIISQEEFPLSEKNGTKWFVPVNYIMPNDNYFGTSTRAWLTPDENLNISIPEVYPSQWIVLNNQQVGFYRIDYSTELWQKIFQALQKPEFNGIDVMSRSQIVDDLLHFARANRKNYSEVLDFLIFLQNETDYYPWYSAFHSFNYLLGRIGDATLRTSLSDYIASVMSKLYVSTPFHVEQPDNYIYTVKQVLALTWGCILNYRDCVTNSINSFSAYKNEGTKPRRNLRSVVYCNGLRYSENIAEDWEFLWQKYTETQISTEQVTILNALGCAKDQAVLNNYLQKAITDGSNIRIQDVDAVFSAVYSSNLEGVDILFDFATNNYNKIISHFNNTNRFTSLIYSVSDKFTSQEQIDKLKNFAATEDLDSIVQQSLQESINNAENNLKITEALEAQLRDYFGVRKGIKTFPRP